MTENNREGNKGNLTQQASKGAFWGLSSNLTVSAISFVGTAILARILSPKDFGLLGMAALITGVVRLFGNLGLGAALVHKKNIDDEYLSTAFWSSIFVSAGLTIISIIIAPFASLFFNEPIIKWIVICLSANFIISSFASVHRTLLYKDIKMKKIAFIEISSRIVRVFIMLICALAGMGFWSIVIDMIGEGILKTILFVFTSSWNPVFQFNKTKFKELFHFGRNIYRQGFLNYFNQNMDFIITGRLLGVQLLGFYQFAYNLPHLVKSYVQDGISPVAFPIFSKVQDDNERLARGFLNAVKYISMITFPVMFGLAFCAEDFISVVYGVRWLPAAGPLKLLCFSAALASVHCIVFSLFNAKGRPDIGFKWNFLRMLITVMLVTFFAKWSILGIAFAMFTVEALMIFAAYIATTLLGAKFKDYILSMTPAVLGSLFMVVCMYIFGSNFFVVENIYIRFVLNVSVGGVMYTLFMLVAFRKDVIALSKFIKMVFIK